MNHLGNIASLLAVLLPCQSSTTSPAFIRVPECRIKFVEEAIVACERTGVIATIDVREGDSVRAGQRLAQLKDDVPRAQLATLVREAESPDSDAKVKNAELAEEFAIGRYEIAVAAQKMNPDSVSRAEMLELRIAALRAGTEIQEAALELQLVRLKKRELEAELRSYSVVAPFSGVVTRVLKQRGEALQPGDAVIELVDPNHLRIEGYATTDDTNHLQPGWKATVVAVGDQVLDTKPAGRLAFVDVSVEPVSQRVRIWAEVDNTKRLLRPGTLATLELSAPATP